MGRQIKAIEAFEVQAVKSAEETKARVDGELRELETTLKNIETARPFEDLTVVSIQLAFSRLLRAILILLCASRTRSRRHARKSTLEQNSSYQKGVGTSPATRYVTLESLNGFVDMLGSIALTGTLGEIWGSLGVIKQSAHLRLSLALRSRTTTLYTY